MRRFTWDDLQFFLAVARNGQLASAARQLRTNHATVSRRIDRLEQALSAKLFERNPRGYMLTAVGERLVQSAEQIEREAANFRNEAASGASQVTGVLRLSTLEGFGPISSPTGCRASPKRMPTCRSNSSPSSRSCRCRGARRTCRSR